MNTIDEFVVTDNPAIKSLKKSIEDLFHIKYELQLLLENNLWVTLQGHPKKVAVAKPFITGLCSPEKEIFMHYPAVIHGILKDNLWKKCLQVMTSAVVNLMPNYLLQISGLELNVLLAQSALEELLNCFDPNKDINKSEFDSEHETHFLLQLLSLDIEWDDYHDIPNAAKDVLLRWLGELNNFNSDVDSEEFKTAGCIQELTKDCKSIEINLKESSSPNKEDSYEENVISSDSDENTYAESKGKVIGKKRKRRKKFAKHALNNIELEQERLREMYEKQFISDNGSSPISKKLFVNTTAKCNLQASNPIDPFLPSFPSTSSYPVSIKNMVFKENLRPIVIDGSNVAMSHGNNKIFSCRGIDICVKYFRKRGHQNITAFVPKWRKDPPKPNHQIIDHNVLIRLYTESVLKLTPSRVVNGQLVASYDDRFIVQLATETGGVIVSNDNYRDLMFENRDWKETIENRLLLYTFVRDIFMPPEDPLGRKGPLLAEFLRFPHMSTNRSQTARQNLHLPESQPWSSGQVSNGPYTKSSSCTSATSKELNAYFKSNTPQTFTQKSNDSSRSATNACVSLEKTLSTKLLEIFPEKALLIDKVLKTYPDITDIMVLANHVIELE